MYAQRVCDLLNAQIATARTNLLDQQKRVRESKSPDERQVAERELAILREHFSSLMHKKIEADMAAEMERQQKIERFTILDPARIPETPVGHDYHTSWLWRVTSIF